MLTIDLETYYAKGYTLSVMTPERYITDPRFQVIGVSVKKDDGDIRWITGDDELIRRELLAAGVDKDAVCCHNAAFDCAILAWHYDIHPPVIVDTLSMARPIIGLTEGVSLRTCAEHFGLGAKGTEIYNTLGKRREDFTASELEAFGKYCQQDVNLTYKLYKVLKPRIPMKEMYLIDLTIRMFTEPDIRLDVPLLEKHLAEVKAKKAELLASVGMESRETLMSNPKFAEALKALGVEPPMKVSTRTGKQTYAFAKTDDGFKALLSHPDERVRALAEARVGTKSTIEETRTESFIAIAKSLGKLPVALNYYGAMNTGRFSAGGSGAKGSLNAQNLPRGGALRDSMRAPEGYKIVACDSSQVEARTLAWLAGEDELTEGFEHDEDVYSAFASKVYGRKITKHNDPEERHVGKTCLSGDTEVLTDSGWKKITDITTEDLLWDGEEWVAHKGVVAQGTKPVIGGFGLTATYDHLCWDGEKFIPWFLLASDKKAMRKASAFVKLPKGYKASALVSHEADPLGEAPVYDILDVGDKHQFVVRTEEGPLVLHNCILGLGYGVGAAKLQYSLDNGIIKVHQPLERCQEIVKIYREGYPHISGLWRACGKALSAALKGYDSEIGVGVKLPFKALPYPHIELPNGMEIKYPDLREDFNLETGRYEMSYQVKGYRKRIYGAMVVENVTQALARIVVAYQMCMIRRELDARNKAMADGKIRKIVNMVHDEVVVIVPEDEATWCAEMMERCMKTRFPWCKDLPVSCESGIGDTYGEAK